MAMNLGELYGTIGLDDAPFASALDGAIDHLKDFGSKGAVIAGTAGVGIATAIGASVVANMSMDAANDKLAAELGLTQAESARIGKIAGHLYAQNYGDSLEDVNDAIAAVYTSIEGMGDKSGAEVQKAAKYAMNLAEVMGIDVTRAAQIAGQSVKNGLAKDSTEAFDLITAGAQAVGPAMRDDFIDAIDEYGGFFAQLGLDGPQAFGLLAQAAKGGQFQLDKTGDAVKEFTLKVGDLNDTGASGALKTLGLDAGEMANAMAAGGTRGGAAMGQIVDKLLGIKDPAAQAKQAIALFGDPLTEIGVNNIPAFLTALDNGGAAMKRVGGAGDELDKTLNRGATKSLQAMRRQAEALFYRLGNWAIPIVNDLASSAAANLGPALSQVGAILMTLWSAAQAVFGYIEAHQTVFQVIATVIGVLLIPALIAMAVQAATTAAITVAGWVASSAGAAMSAGLQLISMTLIGAGYFKLGVQAMASAVRTAAAWLIMIGPIGLVIAAIVGIVIAVVKNWDTIKAKTAAAWDWVVDKVKKVPGILVGFFLNFTLPGLIIKHFDRIKSAVSSGVDKAVSFVKAMPGKMLRAVGNLGLLLYNVGGDIMRGLVRGIEGGFRWIRDKLRGLGSIIPGWLKSVLGINSPSTVMRDEVGQWLPAGVADGIDKGLPGLRRAAEAMGDAAVIPITSAPSFMARTNAAGQGGAGFLDPAAMGLPATGTDGMGGIDYDQLAAAMARVNINANVSVGKRQAAEIVDVGTTTGRRLE